MLRIDELGFWLLWAVLCVCVCGGGVDLISDYRPGASIAEGHII